MLDPELLVARIRTAENYLSILDSKLEHNWRELRAEAVIRRDLPIAFALVHPQHWEDYGRAEQVLGPRTFRAPILTGTRYCSAADYWGVQCAARNNPIEIVADHAWPYSLGGPTHIANIRWLCRRHNAGKSSDVHLYPWEGLWPDWIDGQLEKVDRLRNRAR